MTATAASDSALHSKTQAALTSDLAAVGPISFELIVGIASRSLAILAEAAHSALDLVVHCSILPRKG